MTENRNTRVSDETTDSRLLILARQDNVTVAREAIPAGERLMVSGKEVVIPARIGAGHKIARCDLSSGDKVLKYGAPIGSATCDIHTGDHVHLHNIKSDYIETHSLDDARNDHERSTDGATDGV